MPHSDFIAWLSSATLGFFSLAEQCHTRISHLGWAEPHFDFLAWLSSATLWFYSLAEKCHTQIFCFGWKLPYLDILACLSSATFGYFRLAKHGPLCALHGLLQWLQFLPLFILASSFSNSFSDTSVSSLYSHQRHQHLYFPAFHHPTTIIRSCFFLLVHL